METVEKECGALGGLFQAIVNDMKSDELEKQQHQPTGRTGRGLACVLTETARCSPAGLCPLTLGLLQD
ncbi:MTSS1-like protein [Liparis tanakae]|uniref:MTSS1-like protein n=1 Tax=Liparis tanakae TaxID=230148 RepID=A0A4Z2GY67_9TELE|nr:MTSS1-like protein [Liparis tanakae]